MKESIDLKNFKGFALIKGDSSSEAMRLIPFCVINDIPYIHISIHSVCPEDYVPCATIEWCERALGYCVKPDYYPEWLKNYFFRKIWFEDKWIIGKKLFVKPADRHKRFTGFVTYGTYSKKKKPPLVWSEVIYFINEWRYYISAGVVMCSGWYYGDEVNMPDAPILNIDIPNDYYGALDFGITNDNKFALVESQHPFACGWYGERKDDHLYFQWLVNGWDYMKNKKLL